MQNRKLGIIFLIISIAVLLILLQLMNGLNKEANALGCFNQDKGCVKVESSLNLTHAAFGFIGFMFALGFYLLFFAKGEEVILKRLERDERKRTKEEEFVLISRALDDYEKKVLEIVRKEEGITQNTLRIKTGMSKAKLSYVLQDLEKKKLVVREQKGKTLAVHSR
ncbi:MAG TPA: MarR family transcriptional regulator [Candidatus Nanoarchaeia archaeon]|nr:MarR family transcriptional regulator [Candidatus Nanoarchaeia archaeon]